jgi:hypothetical protein
VNGSILGGHEVLQRVHQKEKKAMKRKINKQIIKKKNKRNKEIREGGIK